MSVTADQPSTAFVSKAPRLGFISGFDGIRGLFVMMMILEHIFPGSFESFSLVLDSFFVMSAFLIVSLLMQEHRDNGRVDLKKFYQRRAVRLLPSAYASFIVWFIIGVIAVLVGFRPDGHNLLVEVCKDIAAAFTYTYHLVFPVGLAAIAPQEGLRPMGHLWSLSMEEQFYMVVAITIIVCIRKNWIRPLAGLCVVLAAYICWARFHLDFGPWPGRQINDSIWTRGLQLLWIQRPDALLLGVVAAVINAHLSDATAERFRKPILAFGWFGMAVLWFTLIWSSKAIHSLGWPFYIPNIPERVAYHGQIMLCGPKHGPLVPCADRMWFVRIGHNLAWISITPVMFCMARYKDWLPNRVLGIAPLRTLGRMSYTLYVWHMIGILLVSGAVENASRPVQLIVKEAAVFAVSWPVYRFIEQRALKRKLRYSAEKETLDLRTGKMVEIAVEAPPDAPES